MDSANPAFRVKTEVFEGPLDLLLALIEKKKLIINDISLSKVADDYIAHIGQMGSFPVAESADFLIVASTLLLIKSKSLIPDLFLTEEEEDSIGDLEMRLKLYKKYKELAVGLRGLFGKNMMFFEDPREPAPVFMPDKLTTIENFLQAVKELIKSLPAPEKLPKAMVKKVVNLETMIKNLMERVKTAGKVNFSEFSAGHKEAKINIIVGFLAMLELARQGIILVSQGAHFSDITMEEDRPELS